MRNCANYVVHCMASLVAQPVAFRAVVIDDCSTDRTLAAARSVVEHDGRFLLLENKSRRGALANIEAGIEILDPDGSDVVATVDGDDWLVDRSSLAHIVEHYAREPRLRMTYGQFVHAASGAPGLCARYPDVVLASGAFRRHPWLASHLRTFRAELWRKIQREDLVNPSTGRHWEMAWDLAMMFPMLEMCTSDEVLFVARNVYVYNDCNPSNDNKVDAKLQRSIEAVVRSMRPYDRTPR